MMEIHKMYMLLNSISAGLPVLSHLLTAAWNASGTPSPGLPTSTREAHPCILCKGGSQFLAHTRHTKHHSTHSAWNETLLQVTTTWQRR